MAIGAMVAHDTAMGGRAFDPLNVERLFSAVQMLADRDNLEVSPFVASWAASLDEIGRSRGLPSFFGQALQEEIFSEYGTSGLERIFREGVDALTGRRRSIELFRQLEKEMIDTLQSVLTVDPAKVDYLAPLLASAEGGSPVRIATLNYDRSVELLAQRAEWDLDTGVELWKGGFEWAWRPDAQVRLLKLHGSVDWYLNEHRETDKLKHNRVVVAEHWESRHVVGGRLGVVFGQRGKLRSDGPFLAMLGALDEFFRDSDHLVVVGYSFGDDHINAAISRWFNDQPEPRLTIINPMLKDLIAKKAPPRDGTFLSEILHAMSLPWQSDEQEGVPIRPFRPGLRLVGAKAADGLNEVFGAGPSLGPPPQAAGS